MTDREWELLTDDIKEVKADIKSVKKDIQHLKEFKWKLTGILSVITLIGSSAISIIWQVLR